jgi:hypothetical protein
MPISKQRFQSLYLAVAASAALAACGGGNSNAPAPVPTAAASCAALKSGTYRIIDPAKRNTSTVVITMDSAGTPSITYSDKTTETLVAGTEGCTFTSSGGASAVVAQSSIIVAASAPTSGTRYPVLLFPDQNTTTVADLNGVWNRIEWNRGGSGMPFSLRYGSVAFKAGTITAAQDCPVASSVDAGCSAATLDANTGFTAATGGFSGTGGLNGARAFAYDTGRDLMVVSMDPDGSLMLLTKQTPWDLPTISTTTSWNVWVDTAGAVPQYMVWTGIFHNTSIIRSVDSSTGTFTRDSDDQHAIMPQALSVNAPLTAAVSPRLAANMEFFMPQTLHVNTPLAGFHKRDDANTVSPAVPAAIMLRITSDFAVASTLGTSTGGSFTLSIRTP